MNCRFGQRRRRLTRAVSLLLPVSALTLLSAAAAPPASRPPARPVPGKPGVYRLDPKAYLPTSQLRAGMKGYGLTVFRGDKIERFDVNILGVLKKVNNGRDLILVKVGGNASLNRVSDIIAGMSGSPVYVNGKIVGAVAYGSEFTKERIGYLTPIEDMLDAWDPALPQYPDGFGPRRQTTTRLSEPVTVNGESFTQVRNLGFGSPIPAHKQAGTLMLRPLGMPVSVSGVPAARWAKVADELRQMGLEARQGIGGGAASPTSMGAKLTASPLQPGGAVAMSLATGDMDVTGVGTLTFRADKRIVAFGHPFLSVGPIDAPMSTVHIFDILPAYNESSKIGVAVTQVGSFSQDRPFSIAGSIGAKPVMVPIRVRINDKSVGRSRVFQANVVRHPALTRQLALMAAGTAISEVHSQPGDTMATVRTTVTADEVGTITRTNRVYSPSAIDQAATDDLASLVSLLSGNPFYPLPIRSVTMDVDIESGRKTAQIDRVFVSQTRYEPGETVDVNVVLRPYMKERFVKTIPVRIPASIPNNTVLSIAVQGGGSSGGGFSLGLGSDGGLVLSRGGGDYSSAVNIRQVVKRYLERDRNDALVARVALPSAAVNVQGEKLSGLPPNIEQALRGGTGTAGSRSSGARLERDEIKESIPTDYILSGSQSIAIRVARRGTPDTSLPVPLSAPPPATADTGSTPPISAAPPPVSVPPDIDIDSEAAPTGFAPAASFPVSLAVKNAESGQWALTPTTANMQPVVLPRSSQIPKIVAVPVPVSVPAAAVTAKPVGRLPAVWRQASATDFRAAADLEGVTISSGGEVRLAPKLTRIARSAADPYYWSLAPAGENSVYVGSGDNGVIYHIGADGKQSVFARTGTLEVHSLMTGTDGTVYAGTSPDGLLMRIAPNSGGKPVRLMKADEKYVLALALSPDGKTIYAGTGGPKARVYRAAADGAGKPEVIYESAEGSVTALTAAPDGTVYAGTAPGGLVVRVAGPKTARPLPLYDATESAITGLTVDDDGIVYAATMGVGRGVLYRIDPATGGASVIYDRAPGGVLTGLQRLGKGRTLYTASGSTLIAVEPATGETRTFEAPSGADVQILALLASPTEDRVWVSTGNSAEVYHLALSSTDNTASGQLVSRVFDARGAAKWGTIRFSASAPAGASVTLQTRSGDVAQPDETWSVWSPAYKTNVGETITSPPGRYLQYRARLSGGASGSDTPMLRSVEVFYLTPNQAPTLTLTTPQGGEVWKGKQTLRWAASDPDRDTLFYDVSLSGDGGKTWRPVGAMQSAAPGTPATPGTLTPPTGAVTAVSAPDVSALTAELNRHPEIPAETRARILADAPTVALTTVSPAVTSAALSSAVGPTRDTSLPLDTTSFPDGTYRVRVIASDKPSNPAGALTAEKISGEVRIVNRLPTLVLFKGAMKRGPDGTVTLEGSAVQTGAVIRAVQFRVDNGDWTAAIASDGLFDSTLEPFTLTTPALAGGKSHKVEVQVQDEAGNTATQTISV